jgi:uncharacterized protein YkwD
MLVAVKRLTPLVFMLLALGALGALAGEARAADAAPAAPAGIERLQALDRQILAQLNATRDAHGLRPLTMSSDLERAAVYQSQSMLAGGYFAHEAPGSSFVSRLKRFYRPAGYRSWSAGENLLFNSAPITANDAIQAWLASPHHRENMLDPSWREVGIGSVHAASAGGDFGGEPAWVVTMDFGVREGGPSATTKRTSRLQAGTAATSKRTAHRTAKAAAVRRPKAATAAKPAPAAEPPVAPAAETQVAPAADITVAPAADIPPVSDEDETADAGQVSGGNEGWVDELLLVDSDVVGNDGDSTVTD